MLLKFVNRYFLFTIIHITILLVSLLFISYNLGLPIFYLSNVFNVTKALNDQFHNFVVYH